MFDRFADWVPEGRDGDVWKLSTVIEAGVDLRDPVLAWGPDHTLLAAARKLSRPEEIVLSHSSDGQNWKAPQVIASAQTLPHISVTMASPALRTDVTPAAKNIGRNSSPVTCVRSAR